MRGMANMRKVGVTLCIAGIVAGVMPGAEGAQAESLTIGAAYSLRPAFQEIVPLFEAEYGTTVQVVYGPSQTLRRDIEQGAAIDVFLPAAAEEIETAEERVDDRREPSDLWANLARARHVSNVQSHAGLLP